MFGITIITSYKFYTDSKVNSMHDISLKYEQAIYDYRNNNNKSLLKLSKELSETNPNNIYTNMLNLYAAKIFHETFPKEPITILIDYFGKEITDGLEVCRHFKNLLKNTSLALRLDTHGGRYVEGLDVPESYAVLERRAPQALRGYRTDNELKNLIGSGVSAASVWYLREKLDKEGFDNVKITCSSGFGPEKRRVFSLASTPVDVIGTGSFWPDSWSDTYATADIIEYNGKSLVKVGREFLQKSKK